MEKTRVGLIGLAEGFYATVYSRACARMRDVEFIGVCDLGVSDEYALACAEIRASDLADELNVPLVHDIDGLFELKPDAVIVTSESADHHVHAVRAIQNGIHVFVGKPMTISTAAAKEIVDALEDNPSVVGIPGEPGRYEEGMIQARECLRSGEIGRGLMVHVFINHPAMINHAWYRNVERSGGPLIEFGTYPVDLVEWVLGSQICSVFTVADNFMHPQVNGPDNVKMLCRHADGAISSLDIYSSITWTYPFLGIEIIGERGCIRADYHNYPVYVHGDGAVRVSAPRLSPMNQLEIEHFMDCVRGKRVPEITAKDFISTITVLEAAAEARREGHPVEVKRSCQPS